MYDEDDLRHLHILDRYEERWRTTFVDLTRVIFCSYYEQPTSVVLTDRECCDRLAKTLKTRSLGFKKFINSQNGNLPGDAYLELAEPFARYVVSRDWLTISSTC